MQWRRKEKIIYKIIKNIIKTGTIGGVCVINYCHNIITPKDMILIVGCILICFVLMQETIFKCISRVCRFFEKKEEEKTKRVIAKHNSQNNNTGDDDCRLYTIRRKIK